MEVKKPSVIPIYSVAVLWIIYSLVFPMYKLWHFLIPIVLSFVLFFVMKKIFPGKTEYVEVPKEPETTGNPEIDALLREGEMAESEFKRLKDSIRVASIKMKIDEIMDITGKIFADVKEDPADYPQVKRFANYYLPTTLKLLNTYDRLCMQEVSGQNITETMKRIENALDTTIQAYKKQLDALFENQAIDIETDITVMESMLKKNGLSGSDF